MNPPRVAGDEGASARPEAAAPEPAVPSAAPPSSPSASGPFHAGELAAQAAAGVPAGFARVAAAMLRDHLIPQHRAFFPQLPWLLLGSVDAQGQPWASALAGPPGFVQAPDDRQLLIRARPSADDPLAAALRPGAALGLLGLQPHTRRRNRANGALLRADAEGLWVAVQQSFGNCPQYIQAREPRYVDAPAQAAAPALTGQVLPPALTALVQQADTCFIASAHPGAGQAGAPPAHGVDISHRGGPPGFVRVAADGRLWLPDYRGNRLFNTLGNLLQSPRAGLLFVDFAQGGLLQLSVEAAVVTDPVRVAAWPGAQRLLACTVTGFRWRARALPLRWGPAIQAPELAGL